MWIKTQYSTAWYFCASEYHSVKCVCCVRLGVVIPTTMHEYARDIQNTFAQSKMTCINLDCDGAKFLNNCIYRKDSNVSFYKRWGSNKNLYQWFLLTSNKRVRVDSKLKKFQQNWYNSSIQSCAHKLRQGIKILHFGPTGFQDFVTNFHVCGALETPIQKQIPWKGKK